uniref:transposase n=1 Tax=Pseudomonas sputi TaxID=2892325 RepID=UPI0035A23D90
MRTVTSSRNTRRRPRRRAILTCNPPQLHSTGSRKHRPRHLTKKGDPEIRRLAYNAAMAAVASPNGNLLRVMSGEGLFENTGLGRLGPKALSGGICSDEKSEQMPASLRVQGCRAT